MNQNFAQVLKKGFAEITKILKDKKSDKKSSCDDSDSDWLIGLGSTRDLEYVESKSKKINLASYNSPSLIITTQLDSNSNPRNLEKKITPPFLKTGWQWQ